MTKGRRQFDEWVVDQLLKHLTDTQTSAVFGIHLQEVALLRESHRNAFSRLIPLAF